MKLMDCTLRDGGNVVGKGFNVADTKMILDGLVRSNITTIEMGNCAGLGAYREQEPGIVPTDTEYLECVQPYLKRAEIGMFCGWQKGTRENIELAGNYGLKFLRVGANAGDGRYACDAVRYVKNAGMTCRYSLMKAYVLTPKQLAEEALMLEMCGADEITIMDSAGTMTPGQVTEYVRAVASRVKIPVAFHGHNNLGLSVANAWAAYEAGASVFDCGLLGMARSAGNCATELIAAVFQREELMVDVDLFALLDFEDRELIPAMEKYGYLPAIRPLDLILGLAGAHSNYTKMFWEVANQKKVNLYKMILEVSKIERKNPSRELMEEVAENILKKRIKE